MNIEFNSTNKKKSTGAREAQLEAGSYEDIQKHRAKQLPRIEKEVQAILKNYHGQGIALVVIEEDENGNPEGVHTLISGVGHPSVQIELAKKLHEASKEIIDLLLESAVKSGDLKTMLAVVEDIMESTKKD